MAIRRVVLIEPKTPTLHLFTKWALPRLGLPILGAILKKSGIEVKIYFEDVSTLDWEDIGSSDLVGISAIAATANEAYEILRQVKQQRDTPVVFGGPHTTFLPGEALAKGADFVVRHEGEETLPELIACLNGETDKPISDVKGLSYRVDGRFQHNPDRPLLKDLSSLPWPDYSLIWDYRQRLLTPMLTSRGCPFNCSFCQVTALFGRGYRFRDTEDIMAEMDMLYRTDPRRTIFFYDDNFTANSARTKRLLRHMIKERLTPRWSAMTRVDVSRDLEMLELMKKSGCGYVYLGLESVNPETLEKYRKGQTVEDIAHAVRQFHRYGISVHGMFMAGSDNDNDQTVFDTVRFARKVHLDTMHFTIMTPLPGTDFFRDLSAEDRIFDFDWSHYDGLHMVFRPKNMSPAQVQRGALVDAMRKFYTPWQFCRAALQFQGQVMVHRIYARSMVESWWRQNGPCFKKPELYDART